jgi:hypothetical protein
MNATLPRPNADTARLRWERGQTEMRARLERNETLDHAVRRAAEGLWLLRNPEPRN